MQPNRTPQPVHIQLFDLIIIQLSNWRWSWRRMIITGMLAPLMTIAALGFYASGSDAQTMSYILAGNVTLALMFENLGKVSSNFSFMRLTGTLYHFATLPIRRYTLVVATVSAFFILSLPALSVTILFGTWYLGVPLNPSPLLIMVVPLAAIPLAGIGAYIGSRANTPEEAGSMSLIITLAMLALGPVIVPPERLPPIMNILGLFSPATYAASALRQSLIGPVTPRLGLDVLVLFLITLLIFWLVGKKMDWRQG